MEENVALDSTKQKKFVKSIKGLKKLIKKNEEENVQEQEHKPLVLAPKKGAKKSRNQNRKPKGLVYLSHIPHGFYEHQMAEYFKQFGGVTNVRVIRSKKTGNSRGCAFVEFKEPAVADIVAETMNNYLMGKRIIKAEVVPPEKQKKKVFRKNWSSTNNPGSKLRINMKKNFNANKDEAGDLKRAKKIINNLLKTKKKLNEMGIEYDFTPVDVPDELVETVKELKSEIEDRKDDPEEKLKEKGTVEEKTANTAVNQNTKLTKDANKTNNLKKNKASVNNAVVNKNLKAKGISPLDSFIKINSDDSGDDSSHDSVDDFDGQAYDKVMEEMDDSSESFLSDEDLQEDSESQNSSDESEKTPQVVNVKSKGQQKTQSKLEKQIQLRSQKPPQIQLKPQKKPENPVNSKKLEKPVSQQVKRKAAQKVDVTPKKLKFEKNIEIKLKNKQFKKK